MSKETIAYIITLGLVSWGFWFQATALRDAVKSGILPVRGKTLTLDTNPLGFWAALAFQAVCILGFLAVGTWAFLRLIFGL